MGMTKEREKQKASIRGVITVLMAIVICFTIIFGFVSWVKNEELETSGYEILITYANNGCPEIKPKIKNLMQQKGYISHGDQEKLLRTCYDRERRLKKQYILEELK